MSRRKRGRSGAVAHVTRQQVGRRDDISLKRDAKAERVGGRAMLGNGHDALHDLLRVDPADVPAHERSVLLRLQDDARQELDAHGRRLDAMARHADEQRSGVAGRRAWKLTRETRAADAVMGVNVPMPTRLG